MASLDLSFKLSEEIGLGLDLGAEMISRNYADAGEMGAFFPLYGTNPKFNGFMDYFYVGNHANSIGLVDIHLRANFKFSGEKALPCCEKSLGTELDLVYTHKFKGFLIKGGFSHMFAGDGMNELKGLDKDFADNTQSWALVMLVLKSRFSTNIPMHMQ